MRRDPQDTPPRFPPRQAAWFFDLDGTLADLMPAPEMVAVDPAVARDLAALLEVSAGALAVISGRAIASIDALLAPLRVPAAGQHGAQRRDASGTIIEAATDSEAMAAARERIAAWARRNPLVRIEDKGAAVAMHYRAAPELGDSVRRFAQELAEADRRVHAQPGKMVVEILPAGHDKGSAICAFLDESPFRGRLPVFVGDDAGDEAGFEAVNRLGGVSIKVGDGTSSARFRLPDVGAVHAWLRETAGSAG